MTNPSAVTSIDGITLQHHHISTNGIQLHVVEAGIPSNSSVFLLHGFPDFWLGWRHQIKALVDAGFHVIIPDQRGYNTSDKPLQTKDYAVTQLVDDLSGIARYFQLQTYNIVGHDWGAMVAWWSAILQPESLRRLAILNVPHPFVMAQALRRNPRQMFRSWYALFFQVPYVSESVMSVVLKQGKAMEKDSPKAFPAAVMPNYHEAWAQPGALKAMIQWYRAALRYPVASSMIKNQGVIQTPTLMIWGTKDPYLGRELAPPSIERYCNQGRLEYLEDCGHWIQQEQSAKVNQLLLEFLKSELERSNPTALATK